MANSKMKQIFSNSNLMKAEQSADGPPKEKAKLTIEEAF